MSKNYAYNYATIDPDTKMCYDVQTTTLDCTGEPDMIPIPVLDPEYLFKYYIDGNWYVDAEGTIPWQSSLI